jgi:hypothetical protein
MHINGLEARDCGKVRHRPCGSPWSVTRRFVLENGGLRTSVRPPRFLWLVFLMRYYGGGAAPRPGAARKLALDPTDVARRRVGLLETGFFTARIRAPSVTPQPRSALNKSSSSSAGQRVRRAGGG